MIFWQLSGWILIFLLVLLGFSTETWGQIITTEVGSGLGGDGIPATHAQLRYPHGLALDSGGNLYIADRINHRIRRVDQTSGSISTVAGTVETSGYGYWGEDMPATSVRLRYPYSIALDDGGNLYIADTDRNRIRRVDKASGLITTVAGIGAGGYSGDGGPAILAQLSQPHGLGFDAAGNLYIADTYNHCIRRVDKASGLITTVAGNGTDGYSGDGGQAILAQLWKPHDLALDGAGNLYIADPYNDRIRRVEATTGLITTIAGNGSIGYSGDGGPANQAQLNEPRGVVLDEAGHLYIADTANNCIRRVDRSTGLINTVVGNGARGFAGDGGQATKAQLNEPRGMAFTASGDLYVSDSGNNRIRKVSAPVYLTNLPGDFDGNGAVNLADFFSFADKYGSSDFEYDLDNSGFVDLADFFLFADNF